MSANTTMKFAKIKNEDGTYSDNIPIGVDAANVDFSDGRTLDTVVEGIMQEADLAEEFNVSTAYKKGDYVFNEGNLYRLTAAHSAGTTWANTSKELVKLANDVSSMIQVSEIQPTDSGNKIWINDRNTDGGVQVPTYAEFQQLSDDVAPEYDDVTGTYDIGDYCMHEGQLYKCTTAIATAEAWIAGHWTAVILGQEVSDLKEDLKQFTNISPIAWTSGAYIKLTDTTVDTSNPTSNASWMYAVVQCSQGDMFIINAYGGIAPRAYGFVGSDDKVIAMALSTVNLTDYVVTAPIGTSYLVINNQNKQISRDYISYKGAPVVDMVAPIASEINLLDNKMLEIYDSTKISVSTAGFILLRSGVSNGDKLRVTNNTLQSIAISTRTSNTTVESITSNLAKDASIDFTLTANADGLYTYINSGNSGNIIVENLKSDIPRLQLDIEELDDEIESITDTIEKIYVPVNNDPSLWEIGTISYSGVNIAATNQCRLKTYIGQGIESVTLVDTTYELYLFGWNESDTCVGFWRPAINSRENNPNQSLRNNYYINFAGILAVYPGYKFRLVLKKSDISVSDIADVVKFGHYIPEIGEVKRRPLLTFIDDDGYAQSAIIWEDIVQTCNIPATMALVTKNVGIAEHIVSWDEVERLTNIGMEFVSHTDGHINLNDTSLTEEAVISDFQATIVALSEHGCESRFVVYPYTFITDDNKELVRKYFSCGFSLQNQLNEPYINRDLVHRYDINLGTGEKTIDGQTVTVHLFRSLDNIKSIIDNAVLHNGWIVFMSHLRNETGDVRYYYDDDVKQLLVDTISYARSKNVEIVTVAKAYEMYRHIMN